MILKALELHGFKSFPDKTVLNFSDGITAVVGPNGSGKSNISDAIRWVLGEQSNKALRGDKMEDVIFNGTALRKPVGFAEVSLIISNTDRALDFDADDVKVTRRCYRSGAGEYLINNAAVRLKDIQMLFMNTGLGRDGYSIIGQGRIEDIVSSKSQERREIFEEAAGIAKYRYHKNEAERRLAAAEENLLRLRDILQELESRVGPLAQQCEKAKQYLTLAGEKKELEIGLWLRTMNASRSVLRELDAKLELARTQYEDAGAAQEQFEEEIEQIAAAAQQLTVQMDDIRRQSQLLIEQAAQEDSRAAVLRNDITHNEENIARIEGEIADSASGDAHIDEDIAAKRAEIEQKHTAIHDAEQQQLALSEQMEELSRAGEAAAGEVQTLSEKAAALALQLSDLRVQVSTGDSALAEITLRLSQVTAAVALKTAQSSTADEQLREMEKELAACNEQVESLQNTVGGYQMRYDARIGKVDAAKAQADKLTLDAEEKSRRARLLEELERNLDGFAQSVKAVMKEAGRGALRGIHGPVSRLIRAQADYALAIETALGAAAQNLVCDRDEDAKRAIRFLKETHGGRVTFLPLSNIRGTRLREQPSGEAGFVGIAADLVTFEPQYAEIAENLLGRTVIAEDMDDATAIARKYGYKFRVVTLDGQVVNAGGSLTGGSSVKGAGLLSRRAEIEKLQTEAKALAAKAKEATETYEQLKRDIAAVEAALTGAKGELVTAGEDRIRCEGEVRRLREQTAANRAALEEHTAEIASLQERAAGAKAQSAEATAAIEKVTAEQKAVEAEIESRSGGRRALAAQREELSAAIAQVRLDALAAAKEIEGIEQAIEALEARRADAGGHRAALGEQIKALKDMNDAIAAQVQETEKAAAALREKAQDATKDIEALIAKRQEGEAEQTALRRKSREKNEEREHLGQEVARLEEKQVAVQKQTDDLTRRLYEEYELTRMEAEAVAKPIEDVGAANRRVTELKNKIRALGNVNVGAIEEYAEVNERYQFMKTNVEDVETSRNELLRQIEDLTVHMREIFLERFKQINYYYGIVFSEIFGGGKGELKLSNPDDILGSGIEMYIQPPGKVILNLAALSGGEKALAAIALLFAILKVTPSPFCVLDEIEAALDDVNVDRYAAYLRRMCDKTQFIAITHRRGTMEEADTLYGVTMQERGVSKLLELRASEVEEKLGLKLQQQNG